MRRRCPCMRLVCLSKVISLNFFFLGEIPAWIMTCFHELDSCILQRCSCNESANSIDVTKAVPLRLSVSKLQVRHTLILDTAVSGPMIKQKHLGSPGQEIVTRRTNKSFQHCSSNIGIAVSVRILRAANIRLEHVRSHLRYLHTTKLFWFRGSVKGPAICAKLAAEHASKLGAALGSMSSTWRAYGSWLSTMLDLNLVPVQGRETLACQSVQAAKEDIENSSSLSLSINDLNNGRY